MAFRPMKAFDSRPSSSSSRLVPLVEERVYAGMVTAMDGADIPEGKVHRAVNCRLRYDKITSRYPYSATGGLPAKPNSDVLLGIESVKYPDETERLYRLSENNLYWLNGAAWTSLVGSLSLGAFDRPQFAVLADHVVLATNGTLTLKKITKVPAVTDVKAGLQYKYITSFFNRIVAANHQAATVNITRIEWCADGDITKWEGDDRTAGSAVLANLGDGITGLRVVNNNLVVFREHSIWIGSRTASPTAPFSFTEAYNGIGCDLPYTITEVYGGLIWADSHTGKVWYWDGGSAPIPISDEIEDELVIELRNISSKDLPTGEFDSQLNEFHLMIPPSGIDYENSFLAKTWVFNVRNKGWTYDLLPGGWSIAVTEASAIYNATIGSLSGNIIDLLGNIEDLGETSNVPRLAYLRYGGDLFFYDYLGLGVWSEPDNDESIPDAPRVINENKIESRWFKLPTTDFAVGEVRIDLEIKEVRPYHQGGLGGGFDVLSQILVEFFVDGVDTGIPRYSFLFPISLTDYNKVIRVPCNIRCRQFKYKLTSQCIVFGINKHEIHTYRAGVTRS